MIDSEKELQVIKEEEVGSLTGVFNPEVKENPYIPQEYKERLEAAVKSVEAATVAEIVPAPVTIVVPAEPGIEEVLRTLRMDARESNQEDIMAKISVAYQAIEELSGLLQRLTNHVNRELGVAQELSLRERFDRLEKVCLNNFLKIKEATRLLN